MQLQSLFSFMPYLAVAGVILFLVKQGLQKWNKHLIRTNSFPELLFELASNGGYFTAFLNIHNCIVGAIALGKGTFGFSFLVPHHLSTAQSVLDLGGVLALADEISTVLLCCEDKTHRAGVSVSLSGEILRPEGLTAGETIWIETVISKVGAALGFAEVLMWESSDKSVLLARVSHIKYMKTGGMIWDLASPLIPSIALMAHRFELLGKAIQPSEYLPLAKLLGVQASSSGSDSDTLISDFELTSHHHIQNHFKFLHGGAMSMAITDAVTQFHTHAQKHTGGKHVCPQSLRWMEMQYLSPCKGKVSISIVPQPSTKNGTLPPNNSVEHIHSFRVMVYACKSSGGTVNMDLSKRKCLAHGSVLFY